jgi:hypothetical protein
VLPYESMAGLPNYTRNVPGELIRAFCKGTCRQSTIHRLERNAQPVADPNEKYAGCVAHCLRCHKVARDNYNWFRSA